MSFLGYATCRLAAKRPLPSFVFAIHRLRVQITKEVDFAMQPLSRVRSNAAIFFGINNAMSERPKVAVKIAECIAEWSDLETLLALFLSLMLNTETDTVLAMYSAIENRAAQLRMLEAAIAAKLPVGQSEVALAIILEFVRPAMKERDRLAHWVWGYSPDLPDALLITPPSEKSATHLKALKPFRPPKFNRDEIFVVTEADLTRTLGRIREAADYVARVATIVGNLTPHAGMRAESLQTLSSEPRVREAVSRLQRPTKNSPEGSSQTPSTQNDGS
jgi:hypothetical protein